MLREVGAIFVFSSFSFENFSEFVMYSSVLVRLTFLCLVFDSVFMFKCAYVPPREEDVSSTIYFLLSEFFTFIFCFVFR